jgi:hypothetical protein
MTLFKYTGPYDSELLADLVKQYTQIKGVVIEAILEDTKNPTLRTMNITVKAPKVASMFDNFSKYIDDVSPLNVNERLVPRLVPRPEPNTWMGA